MHKGLKQPCFPLSIGWAVYGTSVGGIPYDNCKLEHTAGGKIFNSISSEPLAIGDESVFELMAKDCAIFSLSVKIGPQ